MKTGLLRAAWILSAVIAGILPGDATLAKPAPPAKKTLAFVVTVWDHAIYETKFADECPNGLVQGNDEFWWRGLSKTDKEKLTAGGTIEPVYRRDPAVYRGPGGKDVCWNPTLVKDPPLRTIKGKLAFGFNLDGTADGHATPKSCKHEKFTGVDGTPAVDNQMYRLLGCHYGWRQIINGIMDNYDEEERRNSGRGVVLMEITDVDDVRNDDAVQVHFYRAVDPFLIDSAGKILPYASYRIDMDGDKPRYGAVAKGKIVDGVLSTEPLPEMSLPMFVNTYGVIPLRDMRMTVDLTKADTEIKGLMGGYYDFDKWWEWMLKVEFEIASGDWDCPALYQAAKQLADGYPDPNTGECTGISSAFKFAAVPAFILHDQRTAAK